MYLESKIDFRKYYITLIKEFTKMYCIRSIFCKHTLHARMLFINTEIDEINDCKVYAFSIVADFKFLNAFISKRTSMKKQTYYDAVRP